MLYTPDEIEFLVGNDSISILPKISLKIPLVSNKPIHLEPNRILQVPIWLAIMLRRANHCSIIPPPYLSVSLLSAVLTSELAITDGFQTSLPCHWYELAIILFREAASDFENDIEELRRLVQHLREIRWGKVAAGIKDVDASPLNLTGLGIMELNVAAKPFLIPAMNKLFQLREHFVPYK
jgi:GINS complex subunit 2